MNLLDINQLNNIIGGTINETGDLLICRDSQWKEKTLTPPIRMGMSGILFCTRGSMSMKVDHKHHVVSPGSVVVFGAGHVVESLSIKEEFHFHMIAISRDLTQYSFLYLNTVQPIHQYLIEKSNDLIRLSHDEIVAINKYFELIFELTRHGNNKVLYFIITALIKTLSDFYVKRIDSAETITTRHEEYFEQFLGLVMKHHQQQRSVQFYADSLQITPKYLTTIIKSVSGKSASDWIDSYVIQEAKLQLKYSRKSVQEITYMLNFSTQSFFGRYFKRHTGMSPKEYRLQTV